MLQQWQKGIVKSVQQATGNTRRYWIEVPGTEAFNFIPGQFVTLDLPIHEQRNKRWRSYSIASAPNGTNLIELVIVCLDSGVGSKYIFDELKPGSEVSFRGPQGVFVLPKDLMRDTFFICTGTGIAPFRSMMHHIRQHKLPIGNIHLVFGTRTQADLLYADEMRELEQDLPTFHYYPVLSREQWAGKTGYVHPIYEELSLTTVNPQYMLCGWREMLDEGRQRLQALGIPAKDIHIEIYG